MDLKEVKLYGGAIICRIPSKFEDLSEFVPVEDNQEVYVYHFDQNSTFGYGPSCHDFVLSFEILEYLRDSDDMNAGKKLFEDLSMCNESRNSRIHTCNVIPGVSLGLPELFNSVSLTGSMEVCRSKYNRDNFATVNVLLYNIRMPRYNCEFMISYSYPDESRINPSDHERTFEDIIKTLRVVDTNLFVV